MIAVVDYGIGNLRSAQKALTHVGGDAELVADPGALSRYAGIVLPGVGAFGPAATALQERGWFDALHGAHQRAQPILGICVGFQLLFDSSEESPGAQGLGFFPGAIRRLAGDEPLPQIQWNRLDVTKESRLLSTSSEPPWMYFVHSYGAPMGADVVATCNYGGTVVAGIERDGLFGAQFHPEKSGADGLAYLGNFVAVVRSS